MTLLGRLTPWRAPLAAALLAFAAGLLVLGALDSGSGGGDPAARPAAAPAAPEPLPASAPAGRRLARLQAIARARPTATAYADVAAAALQLARETADPTAYDRADAAIREALRRDPRDPGALTDASALAAARHRFPEALAYARRARTAAPEALGSNGVLVDALVELGRLDEAVRVLQAWLNRQPTAGGYARASYLRELRGDVPGALRAMELAAQSTVGSREQSASLEALAGDLELRLGRPAAARRSYRLALARFPGLVKARIGLARVAAARGRLGEAERRLSAVVARTPLTEQVVLLGETQLARGERAAARETFALVEAQRRLLAAAGVRTDAELALFEADHGDPARAVAMGRRAVAAHEGLRAPDALGWALTRAGRPLEGLRWARRAVRLSAADPVTRLHAAIAARDAGRPALARRWLRAARSASATLGPLRTRAARRALEGLS